MLSNLEIIEWKKFRGQPKLEDAVGRVQFGIFWIQIFPNWTSRVNPILSARLLSFNFYELFSKGLIWIVSERAVLYKFSKLSTMFFNQWNYDITFTLALCYQSYCRCWWNPAVINIVSFRIFINLTIQLTFSKVIS